MFWWRHRFYSKIRTKLKMNALIWFSMSCFCFIMLFYFICFILLLFRFDFYLVTILPYFYCSLPYTFTFLFDIFQFLLFSLLLLVCHLYFISSSFLTNIMYINLIFFLGYWATKYNIATAVIITQWQLRLLSRKL